MTQRRGAPTHAGVKVEDFLTGVDHECINLRGKPQRGTDCDTGVSARVRSMAAAGPSIPPVVGARDPGGRWIKVLHLT